MVFRRVSSAVIQRRVGAEVANKMSDLTKRWITTEILAEAKRIGTHAERLLASPILRRVLLDRLNEEKLVTDQMLDSSKELARVIAGRQGVSFGTRDMEGHRALISVRPENWEATGVAPLTRREKGAS